MQINLKPNKTVDIRMFMNNVYIPYLYIYSIISSSSIVVGITKNFSECYDHFWKALLFDLCPYRSSQRFINVVVPFSFQWFLFRLLCSLCYCNKEADWANAYNDRHINPCVTAIYVCRGGERQGWEFGRLLCFSKTNKPGSPLFSLRHTPCQNAIIIIRSKRESRTAPRQSWGGVT